MNAPKADIASSSGEPVRSIEEEISNTVRGDRLAERRLRFKPPAEPAEDLSEKIGDLVQKVAATSIAEIERLIGDLQAARNYLKAEADRIEEDTARYAHLSDTASASVKIITESLGQWRKGSETARGTVADNQRSGAA
jgi:hypothetical protein